MAINANRFIAPVINPAHLPMPDAIEQIALEDIISARMAAFVALADAEGLPYDVDGLETDPIKIDQEAHAYRELLMRARVNDGIRAVLPAYARGTDLDAIAARGNVERIVIAEANPATGTPAILESDEALLLRYLASFAVPGAGSRDAYIYHAVTAWPQARDIAVVGAEVHGVAGRASVYLMAESGEAVPEEAIAAVRAAVMQDNVKPLTDQVTIGEAVVSPYTVSLTITVPPGPAPEAVRQAAVAAVRQAADARYAIGARVYVNAIEGAAYVANVLRVERSAPTGDIDPGPIGAAYCAAIDIAVVVQT